MDAKMEAYLKRYNIPPHKAPTKEVMVSEYDKESGKRIEKGAWNTCYHIAHHQQWEEYYATKNNINGSKMTVFNVHGKNNIENNENKNSNLKKKRNN